MPHLQAERAAPRHHRPSWIAWLLRTCVEVFIRLCAKLNFNLPFTRAAVRSRRWQLAKQRCLAPLIGPLFVRPSISTAKQHPMSTFDTSAGGVPQAPAMRIDEVRVSGRFWWRRAGGWAGLRAATQPPPRLPPPCRLRYVATWLPPCPTFLRPWTAWMCFSSPTGSPTRHIS